MRSGLSARGDLFKNLSPAEITREIQNLGASLEASESLLTTEYLKYLINPDSSSFQQEVEKTTEQTLAQSELLDNLMSSFFEDIPGNRLRLLQASGDSFSRLI